MSEFLYEKLENEFVKPQIDAKEFYNFVKKILILNLSLESIR